jgi:hypothetical protein
MLPALRPGWWDGDAVYRDQDGQLYFFDQDGDLLYFEVHTDGPAPQRVLQLPGRYCRNGGRGPIDAAAFLTDLPRAVPLEMSWEDVVKNSHGL